MTIIDERLNEGRSPTDAVDEHSVLAVESRRSRQALYFFKGRAINPLISIERWFDRLPPDHQKEIAMAVLFAAPDVSVSDITQDLFNAVEAFCIWLSANTNLPVKRAGKALMVRGIIDTFVMYGKETSGEGTLRDWAQGARAEGQPELAKAFEQAIPREPFRHRQWRRTHAEWAELCATVLTDEALNACAVGRAGI